jgi:hypothetical protein
MTPGKISGKGGMLTPRRSTIDVVTLTIRTMTEPLNDVRQAAPKGPRGIWTLLFLLAGLPALFSALVLPFNAGIALPWVAVSWPIAAISGYHIWRAGHPAASAWAAVSRIAQGVGAVVGSVLLAGLWASSPQLVVLIVGVSVVLLSVVLVIISRISR